MMMGFQLTAASFIDSTFKSTTEILTLYVTYIHVPFWFVAYFQIRTVQPVILDTHCQLWHLSTSLELRTT